MELKNRIANLRLIMYSLGRGEALMIIPKCWYQQPDTNDNGIVVYWLATALCFILCLTKKQTEQNREGGREGGKKRAQKRSSTSWRHADTHMSVRFFMWFLAKLVYFYYFT